VRAERRDRIGRLELWAAAVAVLFMAGVPVRGDQPEGRRSFSVVVRAAGVYAVGFGDLQDAGLGAESVATESLRVFHRGDAVAFWVDDGGDGRLDGDDRVVFAGQGPPRGPDGRLSPHTELDAFRIEIGRSRESPAGRAIGAASASVTIDGVGRLLARERFELDRFLTYFQHAESPDPKEDWLWAKLTHVDREPFSIRLDLANRAPGAAVAIAARFRGWTRPRIPGRERLAAGMVDHRIEVLAGGAVVGGAEWDGQASTVIEAEIPAAQIDGAELVLAFRVPRRDLPGKNEALIDLVVLDWIEVEYERRPVVATPQARMVVEAGDAASRVEVQVSGGAGLRLFRDGEITWAVVDDAYRRPVAVRPTKSTGLVGDPRQADYLVIGPAAFRSAVAPLVAFHRDRGLTVTEIDVEAVYDELGDGVVDPAAIRELLSQAAQTWPKPAPRFVLLVGDANRDAVGRTGRPAPERFRVGDVVSVRDDAAAVELGRVDVPVQRVPGVRGGAASDHWYVADPAGGLRPTMAIGRLPGRTVEEIGRVVEKTLRYAMDPPPWEWRRRILWITNEGRVFRRQNDAIADLFVDRGVGDQRITPSKTTDVTVYREEMVAALADGLFVVHFYGHGGQTLWRTRPPAYGRAGDLLTLDDVAGLPETTALPIVLSMTCNSAPFDHPSGESLGEQLLMEPGRGAVAVVAASWRNGPNPDFSYALVDGLLRFETVGEAFVDAKAKARKRSLVDTYNLFGDPALPLPKAENVPVVESAQ